MSRDEASLTSVLSGRSISFMQEMQENLTHVLSFGAGVNSVALMIMLVESRQPLDEVVFADTGAEVPETYAYLVIARTYLERHGIPFTVLQKRPGGDLYATCWKRRVFPSAIWRWSTRDFKVHPIHAHYRKKKAMVRQYIAIAYDEVERMKNSRVPYVINLYPLVDKKITRQGCIDIIEAAGLPIPVKSGCYFCPFNSADRWTWLHRQHPDLYERAIALEERSKHFPNQRLTDQAFRENLDMSLRKLPDVVMGLSSIDMLDVASPCGSECMT